MTIDPGQPATRRLSRGEDMIDHTFRIRDHIADLRAEAAAERLAHEVRDDHAAPAGVGRARLFVGHALIAAGQLLAPPVRDEARTRGDARHPA